VKSDGLINKLVRVAANSDNTIKKGDLTIVGGDVREEEIAQFLQQAPLSEMKWCSWEWDHRIILGEYTGTPGEIEYLERGRIFGKGGDLSVRRDGERFLWNYIGPSGVPWEESGYTLYDFWLENRDVHLQRWGKKNALLWGVLKENGARIESRVGFNKLEYPPEFAGSRRVVIEYYEYLYEGRNAFVWWYGLEGRDD